MDKNNYIYIPTIYKLDNNCVNTPIVYPKLTDNDSTNTPTITTR
jgi:hypothetical protein